MQRNETELAAVLTVRGGDGGANPRPARLARELRVGHAPTLEHDQTASGLQDEHEQSRFAADRNRLGELFELEDAEGALKRPRAAVGPDTVQSGHRRRGGWRDWCDV